MQIIEIRDPSSGSSARIAANIGFNCFQFLAKLPDGRMVDVLAAPDDFERGQHPATHHGNPLLFPFPNRIAAGRFRWDGIDYQLSPEQVLFDNTGNAIHGFCLDRPWRIVEQSADSVTGAFRLTVDAPDRIRCWPTDFEIRVTYRVRGSVLHADINISNPTDRSLPWGFGTHAYFRVPLSPQSQAARCTLMVPGTKIWELIECLPTGRKLDPPATAQLHKTRAFGGLKVDDIYSSVKSTHGQVCCQITDPDAGIVLEQRCCDEFRELVVFTPPWSSSVCMEPYTCVTNAINLQQQGIDAGLRVLAPGTSWSTRIDIEARAQ